MTKKIEAIVRQERINDVKTALQNIGIVGMNISEVRGQGRQGGVVFNSHDGPLQIDLLPRVQFNIILSDHNVDATVRAICAAANTGHQGDGIIFVYPVEEVIRIRTCERGHDALMYAGDIDMQRATAKTTTF